MSMRVNIHQTNAILGIDIQQAQLNIIRSRELRMNIEQENARMQIEWNRPKIVRAAKPQGIVPTSSGATNNSSAILRPDFSAHSKLGSAKEGSADKTSAVRGTVNVSKAIIDAQHRKQNGQSSKIEPGHYTFKYQGGRIKIKVEEIPEETEFINYSVDIYLLQEPSIEITVDEYIDKMVAEQREPNGQFVNAAL